MDYSEKDYFDSIEATAREVLRRVREEDADEGDVLHEECDGDQWVIYTYRAKLALTFSGNDDAIFEEMGADALAGVTSMSDVYSRAAFFAVRADVCERLAELREEEEAAE
jgi:hypothetical protein